MHTPSRRLRRHSLAAAVALALAGPAFAQLGAAGVKGQVTQGGAAAPAGLAVVAVNRDNGNTYRTETRVDGSYVLTGLAPGRYEVRIGSGGGGSGVIELAVGETAALDLSVGGQTITIVGALQRKDVRTSEVGTNVSRRLIENTPQATRNFLSSADLAPGVAFVQQTDGNTRIQAGSANRDSLNVYIDGVGQKNNILRGGLTGQDTSRGNPFPQSAIAEYKVVTQNYKAEYDQVSGAAISAVTRSGTNELHGEVSVDRTGTNWTAMSPFESKRAAQGVPRPPSSKLEYSAALGGPIKQDAMHFFIAYDGKRIQDSRQVTPQNLDKFDDPAAGLLPSLKALQGSQVDTFREHLLFAKIDAQFDADRRLSLSTKLRRERDHKPENRDVSAPGNDKEMSNDETRVDLAYEWNLGALLSESRLGWEDAVWNPHSASSTPLVRYKVSTATPQNISGGQDVLYVGGSPDNQKRGQKGLTLAQDLTYTGVAGHVMKGGARLKAMKYDLSGTAFGVDAVDVLLDHTTGLPYFDGLNCTGTNVINGGNNSDECNIRRAVAPAGVGFSNKQVGLYFQDDWSLTRQLELNLGVRWDYETNMLNNDYVTPAARVAAFNALDTTRYGITPAAGQTYAQSLAKGGININDYIASGDSRKPYKGALAPRLGASYDVTGDKSTVVFGGFGRSYDRTMANHALDELQKNAQAGGEVWLIRNDFKLPYSDQFSIGLRQAVGQWNLEVIASRIHAKNQFQWFSGDRDPNGGFGVRAQSIDPNWGAGPPGFGMLILGDFVGENRTNALFLKADKPYTRESGWGVTVAYTLSDAKTTHRDWNDDIFDWTYGRPGRGWNPSTAVDRHRLVAAGVADGVLPWGITLAGKATLASGKPRRTVGCPTSWDVCAAVEEDSKAFIQYDLTLSKSISTGFGEMMLRMDVLNLLNRANYGGFNDWRGGPGESLPADFGQPNGMAGPMRTLRLGLGWKF